MVEMVPNIEMVRMVNQLMQSPDGAALIDRINKTMNGR